MIYYWEKYFYGILSGMKTVIQRTDFNKMKQHNMKTKCKRLVILLLLCLMTSACGIADNESYQTEDAPEKSAREYEHWTDFREDFDLPYANQEMVDLLREEYGKISFQGTFEQGDPECYDEYKVYFLKLVNNEIPFTDMETGERRYLKEIQDLEDLEQFRDESLPAADRKLYYFFDADGDGAPELGVRNPYHHTTQYIFRYDREKEECFLWHAMEGSWYSLLGSRKVAWPWDGKYLSYEQLDAEGKVELSAFIITNRYNDDVSLYMVMLPEYREEDKKIEITDLMREQGVYERGGDRWFFRVTKEQAEEMMSPYLDAYDRAEEQMEKVKFSYEELFGEGNVNK